MGGLLGHHRDDAKLAVAGAVLFAASYLLMRAVGMDFELPKAAAPSVPATPPAAQGSERSLPGILNSEVPATAPAPTALLLPLTPPVVPSPPVQLP